MTYHQFESGKNGCKTTILINLDQICWICLDDCALVFIRNGTFDLWVKFETQIDVQKAYDDIKWCLNIR